MRCIGPTSTTLINAYAKIIQGSKFRVYISHGAGQELDHQECDAAPDVQGVAREAVGVDEGLRGTIIGKRWQCFISFHPNTRE